uniref:RHS repeat domain-containing protein n=1 Tax=Treponema denticola TaxID=158 RepID=UPI0021C35B77|nr:RHS repeat-associated core domain-containing protein [Treponema denticola]
MKTKLYIYSQSNYLSRTAIEAKILFAVCLSKKQALTGGKSLASKDKCSKKIGVESTVLHFVFFMIIINKMQQSAKIKLLINLPTDRTFGNRWSRYKEPSKNKAEAYRVYVEHLFLRSDARDARIFLKEGNMTNKLSTTNIPGSQGNSYPKAELDYNLDYEYDPAYAHRLIHAGTRYYRYDANGNITAEKDGPFTDEEEFTFTYSYFEEEDVYGIDYGFGLDAPKETEQANPQDLFAYRRNYTWNERNLLTKSSDRNFTVHYRYGDDGQRALKYTDEGRSETLYFNNFFTIHIPTQDQNNPQGLRVHKHIFVGNSRLVTAMTHTDNSGDNEEQKAKRYYYHSDHLGSAQFVTDRKGRQYEHIEYTPYGELWTYKSKTAMLFLTTYNNFLAKQPAGLIEEVAAGLDKLPFRFTGKEMDEETGLYYYGARYLDPKYSRWLSGDPALGDYIPQAPVSDEAKKHNENLPGMGGVFNTVNLHVYHYAGNNPVKYTDPDGKFTFQLSTGRTLAGGTAATAEVGICFSYDKDKGFDFGFYSKEGMGSFIGYAITWNLSITITPMSKEITDISGTALSVGGSGGNAKIQPFSIGGEYSIPLDKSMLANQSGTISVSAGYSSIGEGHSIVNTTQVKSLKGWFKNMANDVKMAVVFFESKVSEFISETIDKFKFSQE